MRRNFIAPGVRIFGAPQNKTELQNTQEIPFIDSTNVMNLQDQYANIDTGEYVDPSNELYMNSFKQYIPPRNI